MLYNLHTTLCPQRRLSFSRFAILGSVLRAALISQTVPDILHVAFTLLAVKLEPPKDDAHAPDSQMVVTSMCI